MLIREKEELSQRFQTEKREMQAQIDNLEGENERFFETIVKHSKGEKVDLSSIHHSPKGGRLGLQASQLTPDKSSSPPVMGKAISASYRGNASPNKSMGPPPRKVIYICIHIYIYI